MQTYAPKTAASYVNLKKKFTNSRLESVEDNPDVWITELESLRTEMDNVNISGKISHTDFIIHILTNLPEEYKVAVESLEEKMQDKMVPLTIETSHTKLNSRFERISESALKKNCEE